MLVCPICAPEWVPTTAAPFPDRCRRWSAGGGSRVELVRSPPTRSALDAPGADRTLIRPGTGLRQFGETRRVRQVAAWPRRGRARAPARSRGRAGGAGAREPVRKLVTDERNGPLKGSSAHRL